MADQTSRARSFADLHVKGDPIIIYNAWDGGSARTIASAGAKAVATGDHPVGYARGFTDDNFDDFSFDLYLQTISDISRVLNDSLPFSVDISNAPGLDDDRLQERIGKLLELSVVGINFEDRTDEGTILSVEDQVRRIAAIRGAAEHAGVPLYINARTDLFAVHDQAEHAGLLDEVIERANAYKQAGASGFFAPGLSDIALIKQLCDDVTMPINIIRLPGTPNAKDLTAAGVSRISYGPVPQKQMTEWLSEKAATALRGDD